MKQAVDDCTVVQSYIHKNMFSKVLRALKKILCCGFAGRVASLWSLSELATEQQQRRQMMTMAEMRWGCEGEKFSPSGRRRRSSFPTVVISGTVHASLTSLRDEIYSSFIDRKCKTLLRSFYLYRVFTQPTHFIAGRLLLSWRVLNSFVDHFYSLKYSNFHRKAFRKNILEFLRE